MRLFSSEHIFKHPWETVSVANWIKYPNPMTPHVTNVDYLSRRIDPQTGFIHTERLLTCKQNVPDFFLKFIGGQNSSIVYERSVVDLDNKRLVLKSVNLTFSHLLTVEETCTYEKMTSTDLIGDDDNNNKTIPTDWTKFRQVAQIRSCSGWNYFRESLEDFSISRFQANAQKGRVALEQVLHGLYEDAKSLLKEKFGDEVDQIFNSETDLMIQLEAQNIAQEAIIEQE